MSLGTISSIATCRSCHLDLQRSELQFVDLNFCLSMLLSLSNNAQVLKIVGLVQDSNLIILGKVHGFLILTLALLSVTE